MRSRSFFAVVAFTVVLLGGAAVAYASDALTQATIAEGVRAGGEPLGGLTPAQARSVIADEVVAPLRRSVRVRISGRTYRLTARRAKVTADVDRMVEEAVAASERGGLPGRLWRRVTGGKLDADIAPRVTHSARAVERFARRVAKRVDRPARDARVAPAGTGLQVVDSRRGRKLDRRRLVRDVTAELEAPAGARVVRGRVATTKPQVTTDQLADRHPVYLTVDRPSRTLRLFKRLKLARTYRIAVGKAGHDTPSGLYAIQTKQVDPVWNVPEKEWAGELAGRTIPPGPENPLKARWLGIYDGVGIHGTADTGSLGSAASHGCLRMAVPEVKELYGQVPVQTPIYIS